MSKPATSYLSRLEKLTIPIPFCGCMVFLGYTAKDGYVRTGGRTWRDYAHRLVYREAHGEIPRGFDINHLCEVKSCLNPAHLKAVPHIENVRYSYRPERNSQRRKTECKRGHPLAGENLYRHGNKRHCRTCRAMHDKQAKRNKTIGVSIPL